jgi:hypothetical protein
MLPGVPDEYRPGRRQEAVKVEGENDRLLRLYVKVKAAIAGGANGCRVLRFKVAACR